jgi:hypothetical protein
VAVHGEGVLETFLGLVGVCHEMLDHDQGLSARLGLSKSAFLDEVRRCFTSPTPPAAQALAKIVLKSGGA